MEVKVQCVWPIADEILEKILNQSKLDSSILNYSENPILSTYAHETLQQVEYRKILTCSVDRSGGSPKSHRRALVNAAIFEFFAFSTATRRVLTVREFFYFNLAVIHENELRRMNSKIS